MFFVCVLHVNMFNLSNISWNNYHSFGKSNNKNGPFQEKSSGHSLVPRRNGPGTIKEAWQEILASYPVLQSQHHKGGVSAVIGYIVLCPDPTLSQGKGSGDH